MLHTGGVDGDCICAIALTYSNIEVKTNSAAKPEVTIPSSAAASSTGSHTGRSWTIEEYIGGVLNSTRSGSLSPGDPDAVEAYTYPALGGTYLVTIVDGFDDGTSSRLILPYRFDPFPTIEIFTVVWDGYDISLNCRLFDVEVENFSAGTGISTDPEWFDGSGNMLSSGLTFSGDVPIVGNNYGSDFNLIFNPGIDVSEWTDLPPGLSDYEICSASYLMDDCVS